MITRIAHRYYPYQAQKIPLTNIAPKLTASRGKGSSNGPITKMCSIRKFKLSIVKMRRLLRSGKRSVSRSKSGSNLKR